MEDLWYSNVSEISSPTEGYTNISTTETVTGGTVTSQTISLDWLDITEVTLLSLLSVFGVSGNSLIIFVFMKSQEIKSTDYLVSALSILDITDATLLTSFNVLIAVYKSSILSPIFCKAVAFYGYYTGVCAAFFVAALAVDRYFLTCRSLARVNNKRVAILMCVLPPIVTFVLLSPYLLFMTHKPGLPICMYQEGFFGVMDAVTKVMMAVISANIIIMVLCYAKIGLMLRKRIKAKISKINRTDTTLSSDVVTASSVDLSIQCDQTSTTDVEQNATTCLGESKTLNNFSKDTKQTKDSRRKGKHEGKNNSRDFGKYLSKELAKPLKREERTTNRTTTILFFISLIYVISFTPSLVIIFTRNKLPRLLSVSMYLIRRFNVISNPIFFISMSSKFRQKARKLLCEK